MTTNAADAFKTQAEPSILVFLQPLERVARDLHRVARAVAVVGDALESHVEAHRRVTDHEVVVHERARHDAAAAEQQRQERRVGPVVPRRRGVGQRPGHGVDPELGELRDRQVRDAQVARERVLGEPDLGLRERAARAARRERTAVARGHRHAHELGDRRRDVHVARDAAHLGSAPAARDQHVARAHEPIGDEAEHGSDDDRRRDDGHGDARDLPPNRDCTKLMSSPARAPRSRSSLSRLAFAAPTSERTYSAPIAAGRVA
jgi:hypothetical protein